MKGGRGEEETTGRGDGKKGNGGRRRRGPKSGGGDRRVEDGKIRRGRDAWRRKRK